MAIWQEQFSTQCKIKKAVILHGNVQDAFWSKANRLQGIPITDYIVQELNDLGYKDIILWDVNDGARGLTESASRELHEAANASVQKPAQASNRPSAGQPYSFGDGSGSPFAQGVPFARGGGDPSASTAENFFRILLSRFRNHQENQKSIAYIIDGADALFGNANSLSEAERKQLLTLGSSLRDSDCSLSKNKLDNLDCILIIIIPRIALLPSRFYQDNPAISQVYIGRPDRKDRVDFLKNCLPSLIVKEKLQAGNTDFEELVDSLEDFTNRDMQQLVHLSRFYKDEPLSFKKLVKLYKFGESKSPWEDLSRERLELLDESLLNRVKGQDHVVKRVSEVIRKAFMGFSGLQHSSRQQMPKGTLFFVGPTGVGKTEMAKAIASFLFGEEEACIRFDMSEYSAEHSDQRLLGAPPGYVGYEEGGQLTNAVRRRPFSVILFDEIEKAHPKIFDKFLQILEDGRLTDSKGDTVSFSETIIIFTSNIGAAQVRPEDPDPHSCFIQKVKEYFIQNNRPELLNRIGENNIIPFNYLQDPEILLKIANAKLRPLIQKLNDKYSISLEINHEDLKILLSGFDEKNGGRGIATRVGDLIIDPLVKVLFNYTDEELRGAKITAKTNGRQFCFKVDIKNG